MVHGIKIFGIDYKSLERESEMHLLNHFFDNLDDIKDDEVVKEGIIKSAKEMQSLYPHTLGIFEYISKHLELKKNELINDVYLVHEFATSEFTFGSLF